MDLVALVVPVAAILVGGLIILLPLAGLVARFALKPLVQTYLDARNGPHAGEQVHLLESRMALMEEQIQRLERSHDRLLEQAEFDRRLGSP